MEKTEIITRENGKVTAFFKALDRILDNVEALTASFKPTLNGEHYLTDQEVSQRLHISRRILQEYRTTGKIPYILLGGKVLYKESDIENMLEKAYCRICE